MFEMNYQLEKCLIALFQEVGNDSLCWNFQHALMSQRLFAEREREKLKRETTEKVNAYMRGEKSKETENVPNGKRCGKYKKKNKKK